mmetsp:Transcript_27831/g.58904  ORF Transcript_27831/g.58904 Transcript_27831/m.58904 type:complete len:135 (-) Transcript_27831:82-486(-)
MPDLVSKKEGGKVLMVSSLDEEHPGDNIIDGNENSYWISTGLYPQEILIELGNPSKISTIRLATTNVKTIRIEGCYETTPVNFQTLVETEYPDKTGRLQQKDLPCNTSEPASFVKVLILSGWHDFCSVHKISVD